MTHACSKCGKEYKSRSGLWKHEQKCTVGDLEITESPVATESEVASSSVAMPNTSTLDNDVAQGDTSSWMDFDLNIEEGEAVPEPLKLLKAPKKDIKKMSAKELESFKQTEIALLKMGLSGIDVILSQYGKGITLDKEFEVRHSEGAKTTVATAQYAWMEEKGMSISKYASTGVVAGAMTAWYIGSPLMRIKKKAQRPMIKRVGGGVMGIFRRLPLIGRLFGKKKPKEPTEVGQTVEIEIGDAE